MILNIETSSKICSVALAHAGEIIFSKESDKEMEHSVNLAPYVDECMDYLHRRGERLEAVAVSMGPGSYTGLRIGLSLAKGLCFSLNLPLIGISTLEILAVKALFRSMDWRGDELFIPMIDARRMEVYTAAYNSALEAVLKPSPLILDEDSYQQLNDRKLIFIGDAVEKARGVINLKDCHWIEAYPKAHDMMVLSEKALREEKFLDIAYSVPEYLKNVHTTTPKHKI